MDENINLAAAAADESEYVSEFTGPEIDDSIRAIKNSTYGLKSIVYYEDLIKLSSTSSSDSIIATFGGIEAFKNICREIQRGGFLSIQFRDVAILTRVVNCGAEFVENSFHNLDFDFVQTSSSNQGYSFAFQLIGNTMTCGRRVLPYGWSNVVRFPNDVLSLPNKADHSAILTAVGGIDAFKELQERITPLSVLVAYDRNDNSSHLLSLCSFIRNAAFISIEIGVLTIGSYLNSVNYKYKIKLDLASNLFSLVVQKNIPALLTNQVVDNLTSTSTTNVLSAAQGKVLKGMIDEKNPSLTKHLTQGWYRIATLLSTAAANGAIVSLSNEWANGKNGFVTFMINIQENNFYVSTMMKTPYNYISKVRSVYEIDNNGTQKVAYIDIYYNIIANNPTTVTASNIIEFSFKNFEEATIPEGYTTTEVTL